MCLQGPGAEMRGGREVAMLLVLLAVCQARSPVFDDDDEDSGSGRSDQHVATVSLEHLFGVSSPARGGASRGRGREADSRQRVCLYDFLPSLRARILSKKRL